MVTAAARMFPTRRVSVALAVTAAGVLLGILGPFGNYLNGGAAARAAYWVGATWLGVALYGAGVAASRRVTDRGSWGRRAALASTVLVASLPEALVTRAAALILWPDLHRYGPGPLGWYAQTALIGAVAVAIAALLPDVRRVRNRPARQGPAAPSPALEAAPFAGEVVALQMEDHYVRVHTPAGSTLHHMPLTAAIEKVAFIEGIRTHRSWWVARRAVERVEGSSRSMRLHLSNGVSAPVARSCVASLRASGWLGED